MSLADQVRVCLPTVPGREAVLKDTVAQWRALGVEPIVATQPHAWPVHHASQYRTARRAIRQALTGWQGPVLLTEDDVDLDPALVERLPALLHHELVTLYAPGRRCYGRAVLAELDRGEPLTPRVEPIHGLSAWYGSLGLLMRNDIAWRLHDAEPLMFGWDAHVREWCRLQNVPLHVAIPNLVQQRDVPPVVSRQGGRHRSVTYGR